MVSPSASEMKPRSRELPSTAVTAMKASSMTAKYSGAPRDREPSDDRGEEGERQRADRAGHPRTHGSGRQRLGGAATLAIMLPSIAVTTEDDSPGVFSRIEVVDPPYIPP